MLELEVGRDQALARIMGKQKWEKFQKFRKTYNQEKFQEQFSEYGVVVPLDI
jgi:lantibiotic modifying enzyme